MTYQPHPLRGRLFRRKDWRKPEGSRGCARPSRYGNPFVVGACHPYRGGAMITPGEAVELFRLGLQEPSSAWMTSSQRYRMSWIRAHLAELRGMQLLCFCPLDRPCHVDVLAELANQ